MKNDYREYYAFLDDLRELGVTNMFGAVPYLLQAFDYLAEDEARDILVSWMKSYDQRHKN